MRLQLPSERRFTGITVKLYSVKGDGDIDLNPGNRNDWAKLSKLLTAMPERTLTRTYVGKAAYELFDDSLELAPLPKGVYMIEVESTPATHTARQLLFVSDVRLISQPLPGRKVRMVVVNATTGQPLPRAKIRVKSYIGYYDKTKEFTLTTNAQGEAVYTQRENERSYDSFAYTDDDRFCPEVNLRGEYSYTKSIGSRNSVSIYTDRRIYRPGQTVHAAAICYATTNGYIHTVEAGKEVTMQLIDANRQVVDEQKVTTDAYGTCHADFTLPTRTLTGRFAVKADDHSEVIQVEEYKRPAFEVDIPAVTQGYEDGDTVVLRGTARSYAGVPVQGAKVRYKVVRRRAYWWMSYSYYWNQGLLGRETEDVELNEGETVTDGSGTFSVDVPIVVPKTRYPMFYNFVVTADVTDQAGETHHGERAIPMGNRTHAFSSTMPEKALNDEPTSFTFHQQNASGVDHDAQVRYRYDNTGRWQEARTNTLIELPKMKSGRHSMQAICEGDTIETKFTVFALDDERPAEKTDDWFYVSHHRFPVDGRPVTLQVGSSDPQLHIVYGLYAADKVIESGAVERDGKLLNRKLTYKEEYGNGLLLTFAWVKNGVVHRHSTTIERPLPDTNLKLQWQTFRNRLTPGQQEEWTLTVMAPDGTPANAQLMATLYDKSLDQLAQHQWSLSPGTWLPTPSTWWQYGSWHGLSLYGYKHQGNLSVSGLQFSTFNHELYPSRWPRFKRRYRKAGRSKNALVENLFMMSKAAPMAEEAKVFDAVEQMPSFNAESADEDAAEAETTADGGAPGSPEAGHKVRENFDETAFFMPQLTTDSLGRVLMKFTLPESLTTWRFMGVAHTNDMMHGTLQDEAVARKEVMIQPNMPRFVRMGDRATIPARVINMSEHDIKGTARLVLLDAETETVVAQAAQPVTVTKDSTVAATFTVQPREKWPSLLIARVTIKGGSDKGLEFSDGEQHYLAVLPNQEHVTVTVPFTQHEPGTKTIDLQQLIPADASQARLTVEYTNNPTWLMIQALPAIGHPHDDCALCQAASYYANSIGMSIIAQNPQAKEVFEQWMKEDATAATTLSSQLRKNEELKDLLLDETPWVIDAEREEEQRRRLADFFDQELMQQRLSSAVDKMKELQNSDGSWSWWPGMRGSWYMTVNISQMLVRLNTMLTSDKSKVTSEKYSDKSKVTSQKYSDKSKVTSEKYSNSQEQDAANNTNHTWHLSLGTYNSSKMLDKAFRFMGSEAVDIVKEIKRMEKEHGIKPTFPSHTTLEWLYLCTLDGRKLPSKVQEANSYLIQLLKKEVKNQSIYDKAMTAIILNSKTYIKSLKEYTVYREDMGRYFDTDRALYSWRDYRIPTQVAAIEALQRVGGDDTQTIEEMQRWLLQEKRTQAWDTPVNSTEAVYAFLNGRSQVLGMENGEWKMENSAAPANNAQPDSQFSNLNSKLSIDGQPLGNAVQGDLQSPTAGMGYVKASVPADGKRTFTAEKTSQGTSWGAVYAQFLQPTATIADQQSGIKVTREYRVESLELSDNSSSSNKTKVTKLSTLNSKLKVGDRLTVRITIEADRDYDFVQVIDKRAACMEPVRQLSGWYSGSYCAPKDNSTNYYFDMLSKGEHVIENEYFIDRAGTYETGTCTVQCAYSPEFHAVTKSETLNVRK